MRRSWQRCVPQVTGLLELLGGFERPPLGAATLPSISQVPLRRLLETW